MKFSIQSKILLNKLTAVGRVIPNKSPIAILSNFFMELKGDTLVIAGSDQDNVVVVSVKVDEAEGSGKFCIDAKRILALLKAMPDNIVNIEVDNKTYAVKIKYTNGKYNFIALNAEDFPIDGNIPKSQEPLASLLLPSAQILKALDKVSFAVSSDDFRVNLQGVCWDIAEDAITFVATDTRILAKYRTTQTAPGATCQFILPVKTIHLLRNIIGKDADVKIVVNERSVSFIGKDFNIRSCLITMKYPDYNRVIPKDNNFVMAIDRQSLQDAVNRVSICAEIGNPLIKMTISPMDVVLEATDLSYNTGASEVVPCEYVGDDMKIGFSAEYLSSLLNAIGTNNIQVRLSGQNRPAVVLPSENDEFGEFTLLLMPMSIAG